MDGSKPTAFYSHWWPQPEAICFYAILRRKDSHTDTITKWRRSLHAFLTDKSACMFYPTAAQLECYASVRRSFASYVTRRNLLEPPIAGQSHDFKTTGLSAPNEGEVPHRITSHHIT